MPYVLLRQDMLPESWEVEATDALDIIALRKGSVLDTPIPAGIHLTLGSHCQIRSDFIESPYFIASEAMRAALFSAGVENIDYYPVILRHAGTGEEHSGYFIGNILGLVSCVDEAKSNYERLSGSGKILRGFEIDESAPRNLGLFRLAENSRLVLISHAVRARLEAAKLQGLFFQSTIAFDGEPASSFWHD